MDYMQFKTQFDSVLGFAFNVQFDECIIQCIFKTHVKAIGWLHDYITTITKVELGSNECFRLKLIWMQWMCTIIS